MDKITIVAEEGMLITDGVTYGTFVSIPSDSDVKRWKQVPQEVWPTNEKINECECFSKFAKFENQKQSEE